MANDSNKEGNNETELSGPMISFIQQQIGVPKPGHIRLMAPLSYDESVRLYNALLEKYPSALSKISGKAGRELVAEAANTFLTKIDRVREQPPRRSYVAHVALQHSNSSGDRLREEMSKRGFERLTDGRTLQNTPVQRKLPEGLYLFDANTPTNLKTDYNLRQAYQVVGAAVTAALADESFETRAANTPPLIFLIQATHLWWTGLADAFEKTK